MTYQATKHNHIAHYYAQHVAELRAYATSRTGCRQDAEDLVQEAFRRILTTSVMITEATLPSLAYTTLRNLITDYWRHRRAQTELEHIIAQQPALGHDPATIYNAQEVSTILERGIARLCPQQQRIYRLSVFDGMPVSEISRTLNLNYKNTEKHLGHARRTVRLFVRERLAM